MPHVLIVLTSCSQLGKTGRSTGFYFDEMAAPYWAFRDAGHTVELASIAGGAAPFDPSSRGELGSRPVAVQRFLDDAGAMTALSATLPLADIDPARYDAIFLPGGHGTMWDFRSPALAKALSTAWARGAVLGAVCHGPAGFVDVVRPDGRPLVDGLRVNSFTDAEEAAVGLADVVPFLLETELRARGARFENAANFAAHAVRDGRLVTGQNPKSVAAVAALMLEAIADRSAT